jgi:arylsulfatase A-like enzyme
MNRRQFISSSAAVGGALAGARLFGTRARAAASPPNILFIVVDEMRYPTVFPSGIGDAGQFLAAFMPNTYELWQNGVKFANQHTASIACSPARGALVTGLYSHQNWVTQTIKDFPGTTSSEQPVLRPAFPTYGKLLRQAGYQTPYIGKWHISIPVEAKGGLAAYGFDYMTYPDPTGSNLQATFGDESANPPYHSDQYIANQATAWLSARVPGESPWCLTVGFVNPHDKEYFPAGTEFQTFADLFKQIPAAQLLPYATEECAIAVPYSDDVLANPPSFGYPKIPPNWESAAQIAANKPSTQTFGRLFQQLAFGGASDDPNQTAFTLIPYPSPPGQYSVGIAPYSYWQRSLDSYTQIMNILDGHVGAVLNALPPAVADNTIIVFTADHGDYASAHGFLSGKAGTCYEEVWKVPLIVVDPTGRFTGDIDTVRTQLTSSIDLLPLLVSLGHNGSRDWITGDLAGLYRRRYDMIPLLRSASAPGRPYVVFATDELVPAKFNFNRSPLHIVGLLTEEAKLGVYANWLPATTRINRRSIEIEFYDYDTARGRAEVDNDPDDPRAKAMLQLLLNDIIPNELRAPLPLRFRPAQDLALAELLVYAAIIDHLGVRDTGLVVGL